MCIIDSHLNFSIKYVRSPEKLDTTIQCRATKFLFTSSIYFYQVINNIAIVWMKTHLNHHLSSYQCNFYYLNVPMFQYYRSIYSPFFFLHYASSVNCLSHDGQTLHSGLYSLFVH